MSEKLIQCIRVFINGRECMYMNKMITFFCTSILTFLYVSVIQALGEALKVRQQVIATGTVYFKRFYAR